MTMPAPLPFSIRPDTAADHLPIEALLRAAFAGNPHSDGSEALIVARLRARGRLARSLVASGADGVLLGHCAFSPVTIDGADLGWMGLGPLGVLPAAQGKGVGAALVEAGLALLRADGAAGCVVLGEPAYYRRFGFRNETRLRYPGAPPEYFMAALMNEEMVPEGLVRYDEAFG